MRKLFNGVKRNRLINILFICLVILFTFRGCINKDEYISIENASVTEEIKEQEDTFLRDEESVIIVSTNWAPYEFEENRQIKGIGVDIAEEAFRRMGYKVTKKYLPFSRAAEMLEKGEIDMITDVKNTDERQKIGIFSKEPILATYTSIFARSDSNIEFTGDLKDLDEYKIGVVRDFSYGKEFDDALKNNILNVQKVDDYKQNIDKILDNRLDLIIEDRLVIFDALKKSNNEDKLKELSPVLSEEPVYGWFSIKEGSQDRVSEFDKKILEMKEDGTLDKIYKHYTDEEIRR